MQPKSVAAALPRVPRGAVGGNELPAVVVAMQNEHQHAPDTRLHLAVGLNAAGNRIESAAAGADHELADAVHRIRGAVGILRREALVYVVVPVDHDVDFEVIERPPYVPHRAVVAVRPRAE